MADGDGLLKAVNMLIMKMLEHGNRCALLLLRYSVLAYLCRAMVLSPCR